jgi:hypothetical protein
MLPNHAPLVAISHYESLSEIARLITGTRWSGPLFFGLKSNPSKELRGVE